MTDTVTTRLIAEHLSTLACLLEAEATRAHALGLRPARDLGREAREVRAICDLLWEADTQLALEPNERMRATTSGNVVAISGALN